MAEQDEKSGEEKSSTVGVEDNAADTFKQGLGLLWKAAKSAATEIKDEVEKGGVSDALQQAGRELETAAAQVGKTLDDFVQRAGAGSSEYQDQWPPDQQPAAEAKQAADIPEDGDVPKDGGVDESTGEKRDMRIQVDDD
jgi:hypothetical protein